MTVIDDHSSDPATKLFRSNYLPSTAKKHLVRITLNGHTAYHFCWIWKPNEFNNQTNPDGRIKIKYIA